MTSRMVMIHNMPGTRGKLKANILSDRCVEREIAFQYEKVGDCYTISVDEDDARAALCRDDD